MHLHRDFPLPLNVVAATCPVHFVAGREPRGIALATQLVAIWLLVLVASTSKRCASEAGARADGGLGASLFALCRGEQGDRRLVLQGGGAAERVPSGLPAGQRASGGRNGQGFRRVPALECEERRRGGGRCRRVSPTPPAVLQLRCSRSVQIPRSSLGDMRLIGGLAS